MKKNIERNYFDPLDNNCENKLLSVCLMSTIILDILPFTINLSIKLQIENKEYEQDNYFIS